MFTDAINDMEKMYNELNEELISYYNKPYNYSKIVALLGKDFGKLLSTELIELIFKAKRTLHILEKKFTVKKITIEFHNSKMSIFEFKERKKYRMEAIQNGVESESGIESHINFKLTDYYCDYETFSTYRNAINHLETFFLKENRNLELLLSQGKSLSYSGMKFNDDTGLFGYDKEND